MCVTEFYQTDCNRRYYFVPLKFTSLLENSLNTEYPIIDFVPSNICLSNIQIKNLVCSKPKHITFRKVEITLNNSQIITLEIPFKFTELNFLTLLQAYKIDNRVIKILYFGEIIRPHITQNICP